MFFAFMLFRGLSRQAGKAPTEQQIRREKEFQRYCKANPVILRWATGLLAIALWVALLAALGH